MAKSFAQVLRISPIKNIYIHDTQWVPPFDMCVFFKHPLNSRGKIILDNMPLNYTNKGVYIVLGGLHEQS